ncbi:MAG: phosphatidylserine decarboxylase [Oscillospiraceae bacterium]|nr:phosphatidylserine decarboxylase [Oscillospiraceae bacterium]
MALHILRHGLLPEERPARPFRSWQEFFSRTRRDTRVDDAPDHLISPCDGWLSVCPVREDSSFAIKGSHYRLEDLLRDGSLARNYHGGDCLIFRLCASDYHRYCYIDDGYQGKHHYIRGVLHSVQPIACETYPVYTLNRRCWSLLTTEHFGPVVQTEVGALIVGGIFNRLQNARFRKGMEKGHFELAGSTITLLFEKGRIRLREELLRQLETEGEVRVRQGMWIADRSHSG